MGKGRLALATAVAAIAALGFAGCNSGEGQPVTVVRGRSTGANLDRTALSLEEGRRVAGPKFGFLDADGPWIVAGASWSDGKSWHDSGNAPCLDNGEAIELGVIEAEHYKDAPGRGVVVWLKCL